MKSVLEREDHEMVLLTHSLREAGFIELLLLCSQRVYSVPLK